MPKKGYTPEQVIHKLREAEVLLSQGNTIGTACKKIGISDFTYYRWRKEYGGMRADQARRLIKQAIGTIDINQILIETRKGGEYQLWKDTKGKGYGLCRIVNNQYVVLVRMGHPQKTARIVFDYYAPPLDEFAQTD